MPADYEEEEFNDFMSKIDDVTKIVEGLKDGTVDPKALDVFEKEEKLKQEYDEKKAKREAQKAAEKAEAEAKRAAAAAEKKRRDDFREQNKEKLEELKQNYYLRKARRERWEEFRAQNKSRAFSDYYKGWSLFEEDPDEELFENSDGPAAVEDQSAFDMMAKDIEERTKQRKGSMVAAEKERESGNLAFKANQYTEAVAAYSRAIEHFKGDKTAVSNRAAANLKLRNWLSALDDCSRVIDISKFLDDDHNQRPPPPPLLKAYVRRATANMELGRHDDAAEDLTTALEMAPESEKGEIKKQMRALKEETAAAKAEAKALDAAEKVAATGDTTSVKASRERVRELLDVLRTASAESIAELSAVLEAANVLEAAEKSGGKDAAEARARAANAAMKRGQSEERATKALDELTTLTRDSAACRIVLRQAGGISTLLGLLDTSKAAPKPAGGADADAPAVAATDEASVAAKALWSVHVGKLLVFACAERKNQYEVHACGGTSQLLRELRKVVPLEGESAAAAAKGSQAGDAAKAATYGALAPQLRLLSQCCVHEKVASEVRRLASTEGTLERLLFLLAPPAKKAKVSPSQELLVASMAMLAALCMGPRKQPLAPHAPAICTTLARHMLSPHVPLAEKAATALGCLSANTTFRKEMVNNASKAGLSALLQVLPTVQKGGDGENMLLPNALAALHNCTLHPDAIGLVATEETAACLIPMLASNASLARRAAAVIAKCAIRVPKTVDMLLAANSLPGLVAAVVSEGASHQAAEDAPRVVDVTDDDPQAEAEAEAEAEEAAATEEEMVGSAVRILTACASKTTEAATVVCEGGGLPALVKMLSRADDSLVGNAALCIGECAKEERCLAVLAVQPVVQPLLSIAHNKKGQTCKNAAIALGRLAKNPRCLQAIRDNHGIEILARAMKGQLGNMGMTA